MDDKAFISDIEYLSLQASIICLLLFILSTTTIIEYPERFQWAAPPLTVAREIKMRSIGRARR
jgi:hypothetical protein